MKQKIKELLEKNNFRNNQNYVLSENFKKNIKLKIKIGILKNKVINGKLSNILGYNKFKHINTFKFNSVLDIDSNNFYLKQFFGYLTFISVFGLFGYFMPIIGFLLFGYMFYLIIKGNNSRKEINELNIFLDKNIIISVNNYVSEFLDNKISFLDEKTKKIELVSNKIETENQIKNHKKDKINDFIFNKNLLNNQNYIFGRKMKNIVSHGMFTSIGEGKGKKVIEKSIIGSNLVRYKQDLKNIIGFEKNKDLQYISYKYIVEKVGETNGGLKILGLIFLIMSSIPLLVPLIFIFGIYGFLIEFILFTLIIYFLYFHKYKFKGFGDFKVIYDKDLIYFIKK